LSNIQNSYRSQRSNFIILIFSSILLAFLINVISNFISEFMPNSSIVYLAIILITTLFFFITIYYGFDIPISIYKTINIPLIFKIENKNLKVVAIPGYTILNDIEYELDEYFKKNKKAEHQIVSLFTEESPWAWDTELGQFLSDLGQFAIWDIFHHFHHSNQKTLRKKSLYEVDYVDYPNNLKNNFLLKFNHDSRKEWAREERNKGVEVSENYYTFKFIEKTSLIIEEDTKNILKIKSNFGRIEFSHNRFSLPVEYQSIQNLTPIKLDFYNSVGGNTFDFNIDLNISVSFTRFANLRSGYEDYIEWLNDFISEFESYDWEKFIDSVIIEKILKL